MAIRDMSSALYPLTMVLCSCDATAILSNAAAIADDTSAGDVPVWPTAPDIPELPSTMVDGSREFHVTAEVLQQLEPMPLRSANIWGYNGNTPGPTAVAHEGETIRFVVSNALPEPTSVHFHAMHAPNEADGVAGINQPTLIEPGATYAYEFRPRHAGVFAYHSHTSDAAQELKGLVGLFVILPAAAPETDSIDRHYLMVLQAFYLADEGAPSTTDPPSGEFDTFTINGKTLDAATTLAAQVGERVRVSVYNASADVSSLHYHGSDLVVAGQNGHPRDPDAQAVVTTFELGPGNFADLELLPDEPGLWLFHCQVPRHTANPMQSGSESSPLGMSRIFDVSE